MLPAAVVQGKPPKGTSLSPTETSAQGKEKSAAKEEAKGCGTVGDMHSTTSVPRSSRDYHCHLPAVSPSLLVLYSKPEPLPTVLSSRADVSEHLTVTNSPRLEALSHAVTW